MIGIIVPKGILSYMCIYVPKFGYRVTSNIALLSNMTIGIISLPAGEIGIIVPM